MVRLVTAVVVTIAIVVFAMVNSHHVELSLVVGKPIHVRLVFLLASAFAAGMVTSSLRRLIASAHAKRLAKRARVEAP